MNLSQPLPRVQSLVPEVRALRQSLPAKIIHVLRTRNKTGAYDDEPRVVLRCEFPRRCSLSYKPVSFVQRTVLYGISYPIQQYFHTERARINFSFSRNTHDTFSMRLIHHRYFSYSASHSLMVRDLIHHHTFERSIGILYRHRTRWCFDRVFGQRILTESHWICLGMSVMSCGGRHDLYLSIETRFCSFESSPSVGKYRYVCRVR